MGLWLLLTTAVAGTLVLWRVIDVAGKIWRERAHMTARCVSMDAAAVSGAMLCERLPRRDNSPGHAVPGWPRSAHAGWGDIPAP